MPVSYTHLFVAVVVIVFGTLLVRFVHHLLRVALRNGIHSANTLDALLIGAGNEDIGTAWMLSLIHIFQSSAPRCAVVEQLAYIQSIPFLANNGIKD